MRFARLLLLTTGALAIMACDPYRPCRSLELGQDATALPRGGPLTSAPGYSSTASFDRGPVTDILCCLQRDQGLPSPACTAEQLQCRDWRGVTVHQLDSPYSFRHTESIDHAYLCYVAVNAGVLVAVWSRES